jgi:uncharacterized glyoxalase superfamily protein PhnB
MPNIEQKRYNTVTPWITTKNTEKLIEFLVSAFSATELGKVYNVDGSVGHAEVQIGDSKIMMFDSRPEWPAFPCFINLYVDDSEALYEQAIRAGAVSMTKIVTQSWGDKTGRIIDPFGNVWWLTSHVEDVSPDEIGKRSLQDEYIKAMEYAQNSFNIQPVINMVKQAQPK